MAQRVIERQNFHVAGDALHLEAVEVGNRQEQGSLEIGVDGRLKGQLDLLHCEPLPVEAGIIAGDGEPSRLEIRAVPAVVPEGAIQDDRHGGVHQTGARAAGWELERIRRDGGGRFGGRLSDGGLGNRRRCGGAGRRRGRRSILLDGSFELRAGDLLLQEEDKERGGERCDHEDLPRRQLGWSA